MKLKIHFNHKEELWNSWSHAGGILLGVIVGIIFLYWCFTQHNGWATAGIILYLFGMLCYKNINISGVVFSHDSLCITFFCMFCKS